MKPVRGRGLGQQCHVEFRHLLESLVLLLGQVLQGMQLGTRVTVSEVVHQGSREQSGWQQRAAPDGHQSRMNFRLLPTWNVSLLAQDPLGPSHSVGHSLLIPVEALVPITAWSVCPSAGSQDPRLLLPFRPTPPCFSSRKL